MAKTWYPVIDYALCDSCGNCIQFCRHAVYDASKAPVPVVRNPDGCVDHCHGCGNRCPVGAICYVGDDTGWQPPQAALLSGESCCAPEPGDGVTGIVRVEYLFLDLETCARCLDTEKALDATLRVLRPALQAAGYSVEYRKVKMESAQLARRYRFVSSPTIRVNERDIFETVQESACGCCGEISGTPVDCRVFGEEGDVGEVPTQRMLADAILRAVFGGHTHKSMRAKYDLPQNLTNFYEGKQRRSTCGCGDGCC